MAKLEVDEKHMYVLAQALERMIRTNHGEKTYKCDRVGVVESFVDAQNEKYTYLILFTNNLENQMDLQFQRIENDKYPCGHCILMFNDKSDMITTAALEGFPFSYQPPNKIEE